MIVNEWMKWICRAMVGLALLLSYLIACQVEGAKGVSKTQKHRSDTALYFYIILMAMTITLFAAIEAFFNDAYYLAVKLPLLILACTAIITLLVKTDFEPFNVYLWFTVVSILAAIICAIGGVGLSKDDYYTKTEILWTDELLDMGNFVSLTDELGGEDLTGQYVVQVYENQGGVYKYVLYYYADDETGPQLEKIGLGGIKTIAVDPSSSPRLEWCTTYECFEREAWGKWIEKRKGVKEFGRLYLPDGNWKIHDMSIGTWTTHNDSYD